MIGERHKLQAGTDALPYLVGDRHIAFGAIFVSLSRQAAVARMIVVNMQVALQPDFICPGQLISACHRRRRDTPHEDSKPAGGDKQQALHGSLSEEIEWCS